jgi:localization factor PodJL
MNRAMPWTIAGVGRRTRDAAEEAARRAGMRLDDWLDEAIADQAALERGARPDDREVEDDRLDAAAGRLERIARPNAQAREPRATGIPGSFDSAIERFEARLSRAEARAACAFESVAQILERSNAARDGERQALIEAVRRLEAIKANWSGPAQAGGARADGLPPSGEGDRNLSQRIDELARRAGGLAHAQDAAAPKPRLDLKAAVSQIAMRRHDLDANARGPAPEPARSDPQSAARDPNRAAAPALRPSAPEPTESRPAADEPDAPPVAAESTPALQAPESLRDDIRALALKLDDLRREATDPRACAVDVGAMRAEMAAMSRSLADLAPRNAVVALEGAIGDLMQRVEMVRQSGHGESVLAPLEAMAGELRAALKTHDPQAVAAGLDREIRAIGGKIDSLAAIAIKPEIFERIRRQTEEVRNLLASAAVRTAPLERIERQIGALADRVEQLGASPATHFESAEMTAFLVEARRQIERSTSPAALASIERRLEQIAARLDHELARPVAPAAIDRRPFEDLARRIDEARQSLEARTPAAVDTGPIEKLLRDLDAKLDAAGRTDARALQSMTAEISGKLDRLAESGADARALQSMTAEISAKLDRLTDAEITGKLDRLAESDAHARGIQSMAAEISAKLDRLAESGADARALQSMTAEISGKLDRLAESGADARALQSMTAEISGKLDRLVESGADARALQSMTAEISGKLDRLAESDAGVRWLEPVLSEFGGKLDRLSDAEIGARWLEPVLSDLGARLDAVASPVDLNPIETLLHALEAKLETSGPPPMDRESVEHVADEVVRRIHEIDPRHDDSEALADKIDTIYDRIDALAAKAVQADDPEPFVRELLKRLRETDAAASSHASETLAAFHAALGAHVSELRAEQASADRRTQSRLAELRSILETLVARLASIESELAGDVDDELRPPAVAASPRPTVGSALPGVEALGPEVTPQRPAQAKTAGAADDHSSQPPSGEDFLIEPGAGAPQRAREARELALMIGPKTNPAVSVHIAAARRAAQAAMGESPAAAANGRAQKAVAGPVQAPLAARGVQNARAFYASHKRTVLLGVALAIAATLAVRAVGVRAPFLQRSELDGQAVKTARIESSPLRPPGHAVAVKPIGPAIDRAPTASISQPPAKPDAPDLPQESAPSPAELLAAIPPGISPTLRDAVVAGAPAAQYELALRLFEGRGLPKDQPAAARWFERAAALGLAPAQYRLGSMLEKGIGVAADRAAAKRWYLKAAEAGNARAAHNLAVMDAEPAGDEPDYVDAAKWFRKAGELGVRDSQYNLAILYARGLGVGQDLRQSWMWFSLAAQQGDADAAKKRDEVAAKMDPVTLAEAAEYLAKFKPVKPDPAANEVTSPPGGWDAGSGAAPTGAPMSQSPPPSGGAHQQTPL